MPIWNQAYYKSLIDRFVDIVADLDGRLQDVVDGRITPALDDIKIGSARKMRAASLFFDIRSFSSRTSMPNDVDLKRALFMLDCVIPMVMHIVYDYGGYIEKNTGDGIMAIIGAEETDESAADSALSAATVVFNVLDTIINPYLAKKNIPSVNARIGIDLGPLLIARIGAHSGSAKHSRNFLTAVGPSANLACRLQQMAGTNQIWVGDLIKRNIIDARSVHFRDVTPIFWDWIYTDDPLRSVYKIWDYNAVKQIPYGI